MKIDFFLPPWLYRFIPTSWWWYIGRIFLTMTTLIMTIHLILLMRDAYNLQKDRSEMFLDIDMRIADIVQQSLENDTIKDLEEKNRKLVLLITYSSRCYFCAAINSSEEIFHIDINSKLKSTAKKNLALRFKSSSAIAKSSTISLIRSVFDCNKNVSSKLLTMEEKEKCKNTEVRVVSVHYVSLPDLAVILNQFKTRLKVIVMPEDPRSLVLDHAKGFNNPNVDLISRDKSDEEEIYSGNYYDYEGVLKSIKQIIEIVEFVKLVSSLGIIYPLVYSTIYSEVFLLKSWKIWKKFASTMDIQSRILRANERKRLLPNHVWMKLEDYFKDELINNYSWLKNSTESIKEMISKTDENCSNFYMRTIYRSTKESGGAVRVGDLDLPLRVSGVTRQIAINSK